MAHLAALRGIRARRGEADADPDLTDAIEEATRAVETASNPAK